MMRSRGCADRLAVAAFAIPALKAEGVLMTTYYLKLVGPGRDRIAIEAEELEQARDEAIRYLGRYLSEHPGFADDGHWQLNVEDASGQSLVHVIVAAVVPRGAAARASQEV